VPKTEPWHAWLVDGDEDDLGLFGPASVTWRVHSEPILALAGLRALYLQMVHPRAMAGVAQNSGYRSDPWGRLERTAVYVATVVYGTTGQAQQAGERLRRLHARMWATDPDTGERFRIDEPDLLRWVHVTEVDSFLTTARRAGLALTDGEADRYLDEQRRAAELVGLAADQVPGSVAEVRDYYREMLPSLRMTRAAAESLLFLSTPPLPWGLGYTPVRGAWLGLSALAVSLLPPWARKLYGLPGLPTTDLTASLSTRMLRLTLRTLPRNLFEGPIYKSAMARAARAA
jgi:uncharacterized protein (DUF2236 family)